jgi:biopolymer transport protein TolR
MSKNALPTMTLPPTSFFSILAVVVVALIFLSLMAQPTIHYGAGVDVPRAEHPRPMPGANRRDALMIAVARDGRLYFGSSQVTPDQLPLLIRMGVSRGAERKVYIKADARARYGDVLDAVDGIRSAGVEDIAFLVQARGVSLPGPAGR